jgi:F0F1-type ATP synthase assembly protein I
MASVGKRETCVIQEPDTRSAFSIGLDWGARVTTIGLEFALPAFLGLGLDRWWGTSPWMTVVGAFLGLATGMTHVLRLASRLQAHGGTRARAVHRGEHAGDPSDLGPTD